MRKKNIVMLSILLFSLTMTLPTFKTKSVLEEAGSMDESISKNWWLNAGGQLHLKKNLARTIQGELPTYDKWRILYARSNPIDTENGFHPQNIFRLVTKTRWGDIEQKAYFKIRKYNLSKSPRRDGSNGIFFMQRYNDGDNLYYAGIRVDGQAVVKKKMHGVYYTLGTAQVVEGAYDREKDPNLLPEKEWFGLKTEVSNIDHIVEIKVFIDKERNGNWSLVLEAVDDGSKYGPSLGEGHAGIRTDFMDVEFEEYSIKEIPQTYPGQNFLSENKV